MGTVSIPPAVAAATSVDPKLFWYPAAVVAQTYTANYYGAAPTAGTLNFYTFTGGVTTAVTAAALASGPVTGTLSQTASANSYTYSNAYTSGWAQSSGGVWLRFYGTIGGGNTCLVAEFRLPISLINGSPATFNMTG